MKEVIIVMFILIMALYGLYHFIKSTAVDILKTIHRYRKKKGENLNAQSGYNGSFDSSSGCDYGTNASGRS